MLLITAVPALQPAAAQSYEVGPQPQFREDRYNEQSIGEDMTWKIVEIMSKCMAGQNPRTTLGLLATLPGSDSEMVTFDVAKPLIETCMRAAFRLTPGKNGLALGLPSTGFRGAFAEATLRRQPAWQQGVAPNGTASLMRHFEQAPDAAGVAAKNRSLFMFYDLADCTLRQDWPRSSAFLRTVPRSPEEKTAFRALSEGISACVLPNVKMSVEPRSFRGVLAEAALYALASDQYPVGNKHLRK